jgi:hypothetical protein
MNVSDCTLTGSRSAVLMVTMIKHVESFFHLSLRAVVEASISIHCAGLKTCPLAAAFVSYYVA